MLCCEDARVVNKSIKIKCIDMQIQFVGFFVNSIKYIREAGDSLQSGM
jgi:hypothetical protein